MPSVLQAQEEVQPALQYRGLDVACNVIDRVKYLEDAHPNWWVGGWVGGCHRPLWQVPGPDAMCGATEGSWSCVAACQGCAAGWLGGLAGGGSSAAVPFAGRRGPNVSAVQQQAAMGGSAAIGSPPISTRQPLRRLQVL
jgi:hypothetical protein